MATDLEQPSSMVFVQASELFPKKTLASDDDSIQVPFPVLNGESIEYLGQTSDAILALSNFRLFIRFKDSFVNVPLRLIEFIGMKDPSLMEVNCKDARSFKILFDTNEQSLNWFEKLNQCISPVSRLEDLFAFPFYAWYMDDKQCFQNSGEDAESLDFCQRGGGQYSFMSEVRRMGFDNLQNAWRITDINTNFELCSTYPKLHIVPAKISDDNVKAVVKFRTSGRFPSVVWRHMTNGAAIARCSQPEVGLLGWRSPEDEALLHAIGTACAVDSVSAFKNRFLREMDHKSNRNSHTDAMPSGDIAHSETYGDNKTDSLSESGIVEQRKVLIVDARAYSAAVMNRAKGGGCECEEYYPGCEVLFMNLANIHTIRKSFQCLRMLCSGPRDAPNWWSNLEKTNWLHHISLLLKASNIVVNAIHEEQRPVVVHCSDGWDRTTQIVALAELMLDPYYRTIEGFQVLVSREWLEFGHRFADRCGHGKNPDENQRCPVFLQWLDCVHQLTRQFPCSFEFNETYLVKLAQHTYSCLFGTFLCNSENEQLKANIPKRTFSVWSLFKMKKREYRNFLYSSSSEQVFQASCQPRCLQLWSAVYLAHPTPYSEALLLENGDTSDYGDSVSSACITPVSPIFPNDGIDHEEVTRSSHVVTSKSDGNLACKLCLKNRNELDEKNKQFISFDSNLKSRSCPECRTDFYENGVQCNVVEAVASESRSLYLSAQSDSNAVSIVSCDDSISEVESMSSSTATIILDPSEGDLTVESRHSSSEKISSGHLIKETNETKCLEEDSSAHKEQRFEEGSNEQSVTVDGSAFCRAMICDEEKTECVESISQELFTNSGSASTFTGPVQGTSSSTTTLRASSSELFTKYLDVDGLTYISDPVQERLRQIEMDHQANLELLQRQVIDAQRRRIPSEDRGATVKTSDLADEVCSLPESSVSGEQPPPSLSSADEGSWIQVEENEVKPTLWVPDHAATNCAKCDTQFWIANRKHHCRNCGLVFCGTCSEKRLPLPEEQLYDPVRVCFACFEKLVTLQERENARIENAGTALN